jgi:hypothetical protein
VLQRRQSIDLVWEDLGILRDARHGEHLGEVLRYPKIDTLCPAFEASISIWITDAIPLELM